ncbi:putative alkaline phytoceramidase [Annulohypoxylon stygium]|nr:putative alkaline phytoceramidase [Annulohypoxylon stygium]
MSLQSFLEALSFPYHEPRHGFWGEKTSTLNFCEEDYAMSYYCAEVCNTLTNALFIWLGYKGIRGCITNSHPPIFFVTFIGYVVVGLGSTFFHASLKYPMQLVDELAMIYTTCFMCFATFSYARSARFSFFLGLGLISLAWFITARYYTTKDPVFHQNAYAVLTAIVVFSNMWIMERVLRPALQAREESRRENRAPSSPRLPTTNEMVRQMWVMVATGLSIFLGGYLIWNLDNMYCSTVLEWRHRLQLPWAVVLEGHAWWHLMTGIGAYYYIIWRIWIHRVLDGEEDKFRLHWPSIFKMPDVVPIEDNASASDKKRR